MFEQSSIPKGGTRIRWTVACALMGQLLALGIQLLIPLLYEPPLPAAELTTILDAPPPPPEPVASRIVRVVPRHFDAKRLFEPRTIPKQVAIIRDLAPALPSAGMPSGIPGGVPGGRIGGVIGDILNAVPSRAATKPPEPIHVGGDVEAARLISAPQPALLCAAITMSPLRGTPEPQQQPDVQGIVARSVAANAEDWAAAPDYNFTECDRNATGKKTFDVMMIYGSPYYRLVAKNDEPLTATENSHEQQRLEMTIAQRRAESPRETARRIAKYRRDSERDRLLMSQLTEAFDFRLEGQQKLGSHDVYVLKATPRSGYHPVNLETQVLTGMEGTLWIDRQTFQWVKVEAHVVHPVSIEGFLARVQPGTFFELENAPVGGGIWLHSHFAMRSRAKVLLAFNRNGQEEETYSDYRPAPLAPRAVNGRSPVK